MTKRGGPRKIPQGRAPLPKAGEVTRDNPIHPDVGATTLNAGSPGAAPVNTEPASPSGPLTPAQLDPRPPMESDAAPTRLDFERLKYRVDTHAAIIRRLLLVLPASAQGEIVPILDEVETVAAEPSPGA